MRHWIFGLLALCVGSVATSADPCDAKDYILVKPVAPSSSEKIEVVDFFSYTCGHCFRLSPLIEEWAKKIPNDITLVRSPVAWDESTEFLARVYFTFDALGRLEDLHPLFWQDIMGGKITSSDSLTAWLTQNKVDLNEWDKLYNSFAVNMSTKQAAQRWQDYQLDATPYIGVAGKYLTAPHLAGSRQKSMEVLNWLIDKERKERQRKQ